MAENVDLYVINLDKDQDRLKKITEVMKPHPIIRVPGVYGKDMDFSGSEEIFFTSRYLSPKSINGASMSHRKAVKLFYETSHKPYAVILEDDAVPVLPNYMDEIQEAIRNAPADWDVIKLDYVPMQIGNIQFNDPNTTAYTSNITPLFTAYIINKRSAEAILKTKIYYYPDLDIHFYGLKLYNNPKIIFKQVEVGENHSHSMSRSTFNPFPGDFDLKAVRIFDSEFTFVHLTYFLIALVSILVGFAVFGRSKAKRKAR